MRLSASIVCVALVLGIIGFRPAGGRSVAPADAQASHPVGTAGSTNGVTETGGMKTEPTAPVRYRLDAGRSKFMVRAFSGGLLWFKGHDHSIAVREFSGEAQLSPGAASPASLQIRIRADSLATGNLTGGQFEAKIGGDLTLHGVTRRVVIPAQVTLAGDTLRARGEFTVKRGDFNVKATSAAHGLMRVRDKLKFTFDIVAPQI